MIALDFFAPGVPKAGQTGSVVTVRGRSFPIRRGASWSSYVAFIAQQHKPAALLCGPLSVRLVFYLPRPKHPRHRTLPITRPDVDNLGKGLVDKLNGILWVDDSQVVELVLAKFYAESDGPGLHVEVREVVA